MKQYTGLDDTLYFWFAANDTSGSGGDGATPACNVRLAGAAANAAPVYSPTPVLLSHADYPAGCYEVAISATLGNGFALNNTYAVFCTLAVDSQNPTGFVGSFDLKPIISAEKDKTGFALSSAGNTAVIDEFETQSAADPTGFRVNTMEVNGTAQTANDNGADINAILADTDNLQSNQSNWFTATGFSTPTDITDALTVDQVSELTGDVGATPTITQMLMRSYMETRDEKTTTETLKTIKNNAGASIITKTISDNGTTCTEGEDV